jgi:hypothetical protein
MQFVFLSVSLHLNRFFPRITHTSPVTLSIIVLSRSQTPIVNAKKAALSDMRSKMMAMRRQASTTPTAASADGRKVEESDTSKTKGRTGAEDLSLDESRDEGDAVTDTVFSRRTAIGGEPASPSD